MWTKSIGCQHRAFTGSRPKIPRAEGARAARRGRCGGRVMWSGERATMYLEFRRLTGRF